MKTLAIDYFIFFEKSLENNFILIKDIASYKNEAKITKEKAKEIIDFLTKFVEGE